MTKLFCIIILTVLSLSSLSAQISGSESIVLSPPYSFRGAELLLKKYVTSEILDLPSNEVIEVKIDVDTPADSGGLITGIYECKALEKRGIIFGFWNSYLAESTIKWRGFAFKHLEFTAGQQLLSNIDNLIEEKNTLLAPANNANLSKNAVYKFEDLMFIFSRDAIGSNRIQVIWNDFNAEWNQNNFKMMTRRFYKVTASAKP